MVWEDLRSGLGLSEGRSEKFEEGPKRDWVWNRRDGGVLVRGGPVEGVVREVRPS